MNWYKSEESLTVYIIGIAILITIGPLFLPSSIWNFCKTDLFAIITLVGVVWYGRDCNPQAMIVMIGLLLAYLFLSSFKNQDRETFCPMELLGVLTPDKHTSFVQEPSPEPAPKCSYISHPSREKSDWKESPPAVSHDETIAETADFDAYEQTSNGGADFNASFH